jgi:predicted amidohydrolase
VAQGADLICLTEAFSKSGNILETADVSVPIPGPETEFLCEQAKQAGVHIVAGLLERGDDGKYYSTSVLCGPEGTMLGRYRRVHCHELEARYLSGGSDYPVFDVEFGRIGLMQGYDINFPEVAREYCRRGVDIIVCSALVPEMFAYVANMRLPVRAVDAECIVAFASGIGTNLAWVGRT